MMGKAGGLDIVRRSNDKEYRKRGIRMRDRRGSDKDSNSRSAPQRVIAGMPIILMGLAVFTAAVTAHGVVAYAAQEEAQSIPEVQPEYVLSENTVSGKVRSKGRVQYEHAVIDGDDLRGIDTYISEKKDTAARTLIRLGTRFRQQPGEYAYDRNPDAGQGDIDLSGLSWSTLTQAAKESQSVPAGLPVLNPEAALHIEGVAERTDFYEAASEDNISSGKAAWVDGRLLLGNGADNDKAYQQGLSDGVQGNIPESLRPIYGMQESGIEIRHAHIGRREQEGTFGCYYNHLETSREVISCDLTLKYCDVTWHPNENEPGGGTYHGGFYTCSHHGGTYDSPGICSYEKVIIRTGWSHDVICGLGNMLYARLTIKEADADQTGTTDESGRICLKAVLEEGEGYDRLAWQEGEGLVWTDNQGNTLGMGSELMVFEPGIYRCSINVANADIDGRTAEAAVKVSGLMMHQGN